MADIKRAKLKRIAATLAALMAFEAGAVPLAQSAMIGRPVPAAPLPAARVASPALNAARAERPASAAPFRLPAAVGATVEIHAPETAGRLVYHVQDVHGHVGAQTNLSAIVSRLQGYAASQGKRLVVAVEGAAGVVPTDELAAFEDAAVKDRVASALLRSGFLNGEERAAIVHKPGQVKVVGVETPSLYNRNVKARERSVESRERVLSTVREIKSQLNRLREHNFNATLTTLEDNRAAVEAGRMAMADYALFLFRTNPTAVRRHPMVHRMVALGGQEKAVDFARVEKEGRLLVEEVLRQSEDADVERLMNDAVALREGRISQLAYYTSLLARSGKIYPSLKSYVSYLRESEKLDPDALFLELEKAEDEIAQDLVRHPIAYALYRDLRWIERQERFFSLNMVPLEWQKQKDVSVSEIHRRHGEIRAFVDEQVAALGYTFSTPAFSMSDLRVAVRGAAGFYRAAEARDAEMVANLRKVLASHGDAVVALVAGGFHTPGLTRELRGHGIAYQVVRPQLEAGVRIADDITYPDFKPQARLLSDRAHTDFLRYATNVQGPGVQTIRNLFIDPAARVEYPAAETADDASEAGLDGVRRAFKKVANGGPYDITILMAAIAGAVIVSVGIVAAVIYRRIIRRHVEEPQPEPETVAAKLPIDDSGIDLESPEGVRMMKRAPAELLPAVLEAAKVFGLEPGEDMSDILYIAVQYSQYLGDENPLVMFTGATAKLNPEDPEPGNPEGANFQVSALQPGQTFPLLGVIDLKDVPKRSAGDAPIDVRVVVNPLDGGIGENYTRVIYMAERAEQDGIPAGLGAKGTDLAHPVVVVRTRTDGSKVTETRNVSLAEMKLLQLLHKKKNFAETAFEPLVNKDSKGSYERLLDQRYLRDVLDDNVAVKRTYREVLTAAGIELPGSHLQKDLFGVKADDLTLPTVKEGVPAQPGGHAQLGFWFYLEALKKAEKRLREGIKSRVPTIRVFYNGDNLNSRPNENLIQNMISNNHVAYMVATPAEAIDKKGGKKGLRWQNVNGAWVPVPDMMELAQAKAVKQLEPFYAAGQEGGLGIPGAQLFNTNQQYINEELLGDILLDLKQLLRDRLNTDDEFRLDFELAQIYGPTLIPKDAKNGYFPIDGAIGSVALNLNAYFLINQADPEIAGILERRGIDRIVHIINSDRMEAFTPEKSPADRLNEEGRFRIESANENFDENEWIFRDLNPDLPMPDIEVFGKVDGESTANWKNDAGAWADVGTLRRLLKGLVTVGATYLGLYGRPVRFPEGTKFSGRVRVTNHTVAEENDPIETNLGDFKGELLAILPEHVTVINVDTPEGWTVELRDVHLEITSEGLKATPLTGNGQPFHYLASYLAGALVIAFGVTAGLAFHPFLAALAGFGVPFVYFGYAARAVLNGGAGIPDGTLLSEVDPDLIDPASAAAVTAFAATVGKGQPIEVVISANGTAEVIGGRLHIGRGLIAKDAAISNVERRLLLRAVLRHDLAHFGRFQFSDNTGVRWLANELIAWPLGIVNFFLPAFMVLNFPAPSVDASFASQRVLDPAADHGSAVDEIGAGARALGRRVIDQRRTDQTPANIVIDGRTIDGLSSASDDSVQADVNLLKLLAEFHLPAATGDDANAEVVLTADANDAAQVARFQRLVELANDPASKITGMRFTLFAANGPIADPLALFTTGRNVTAANTVVIGGDSALSAVGDVAYEYVSGMPQLAVATFAYANYTNGRDVYRELARLLRNLPEFNAPTLTESITTQIIAAIQA